MLRTVRLLLQQQGIRAFDGAAIDQDDFSHAEFQGRYGEAFDYSSASDKQVTVALGGGLIEKTFVVGSFDQLWHNRYKISGGHGIKAVLRMPSATWEKLRAKLEPDRIDDLTALQAAA